MKIIGEHVLPRDVAAESETAQLVQDIFDKPEYKDDDYERESHVAMRPDHLGGVVAEARSALLHGSRLEISVRGTSSAEAVRLLLALLRTYREVRAGGGR